MSHLASIGRNSPNPHWIKDFALSALVYERPLGQFTPPPKPLWSVALGCFVRPQPAEFLEIPTSAVFRQTVAIAVPVYQRHLTDSPEPS